MRGISRIPLNSSDVSLIFTWVKIISPHPVELLGSFSSVGLFEAEIWASGDSGHPGLT